MKRVVYNGGHIRFQFFKFESLVNVSFATSSIFKHGCFTCSSVITLVISSTFRFRLRASNFLAIISNALIFRIMVEGCCITLFQVYTVFKKLMADS